MACPDDNALAALSEGRVPEPEATRLREHIEGCDDCRRALALAASASQEVTSERLRQGETVGRYVVIRLLGSGGTADVYAAYDPELDRKVALKLWRPGALMGGDEQLLTEAKVMARLNHPNVVTVHDAGRLVGRVFLAMELVDGRTLADWLPQAQSVREIVEVFAALGRGLGAAHAAGVVHRDFKPANTLLGVDGRARVADFGLALTGKAKAEIAGTLRYIAPEVMRGEPADARSDQFSFCASLSHALEGRKTPRWLQAAVERGGADDPQRRFPSMEALVEELTRDRLKTVRRVFFGALPLAVLAAAIGAWTLSAQQRCHQGAARGAEVWNDRTRAKVKAAFDGTRLPFASTASEGAMRTLDRWRDEWATAADRACVERERSGDAAYARQTLCLESRLDEARALVDLFSAPDSETVSRAIDTAADLSSASSCLVAQTGTARPDARALAAAQAIAAQARVWFDAGQQAKALARAKEAVAAAAPLGSRALTAQAQLVLGMALTREGDDEGARSALFDAAIAAEASGEDALAMRAWGRMAVEVAEREPSAHASQSWGRLARAALDRAGGGALLEAELDDELLAVARAENRTADVLELAQKCLALRQQSLGPDHPLVGRAQLLLGLALHGVGRTPEAEPLLAEARARVEKAYGRQHPEVATVANAQGLIALRLWKLSEAKRLYAEGLAIAEAVRRDGSQVGIMLDSLGNVETTLGEYGPAREHLTRALELKRALPRPEHPSLASSLLSMAALELAAGAPEKSLALAREADLMLEPLLGLNHPARVRALVAVSAACRAVGQLECSREQLKKLRTLQAISGTTQTERQLDREEGELALAEGHPEVALEAFRRGVAVRDEWEEHRDIGRALAKLGRRAEAQAELEQAVKMLQPLDHPKAKAELAELLAK
ncbi:MAG: tetratricopeptide repeat protein [Myxococcaceae bacterium]